MEWICVEDRLPEFHTKVLVFGESKGSNPQMGGGSIFITERKDLKNTSLEGQEERYLGNDNFYANYVTHWMNLPNKPTKSKKK